jgi:hypothetical protein
MDLAMLCARRGLDDEAIAELAAARAADPRWFGAHIDRFARATATAGDVSAAFRDAVAGAARATE